MQSSILSNKNSNDNLNSIGSFITGLDLPEMNTSKNWRSRQFRNINIVVHDDMRDVDVEK